MFNVDEIDYRRNEGRKNEKRNERKLLQAK